MSDAEAEELASLRARVARLSSIISGAADVIDDEANRLHARGHDEEPASLHEHAARWRALVAPAVGL